MSNATASRALSEPVHPDVRRATAEHVRAVAEELGFRPNSAARALRTGRSRTLVATLPGRSFGWWDTGLRAAAAAARELGYHVFAYPLESSEPLTELLESVKELRADGVLLVTPGSIEPYRAHLSGLDLPIVLIEDELSYDWVTTVCAHNEEGGYLAARHLLELGHRRIAAIAPAAGGLYVEDRLAGYRRALREYGVAVDPALIIASDERYEDPASASSAVRALLDQGMHFDALFCLVDYLAAGALMTLRAAGMRVPDDISVVGFDDERAARLVDPPLTTIRQPIAEMGELAVRLLIGSAKDGLGDPRRHELPVELIVRASTGPAANRG